MFSFLSEFTQETGRPRQFIVMDEDQMGDARQYRVVPRTLWLLLGSVVTLLLVLVVSLIAFTPVRELIPGYGSAEMREEAVLNMIRLAELRDSLEAQQFYMNQLRNLLTGAVDTAATGPAPEPGPTVGGELADMAPGEPTSDDWQDHAQPAIPITEMPAATDVPARLASADARYLSSLQFPVLPPVDGYFTRGFDARQGHYAIDLAVEEGDVVRAVGDGYVIFSDWTQEGGFTIAVQHADGYVSVYKHNERLLKRVGDRVRDREAIASSGDSGEYTTGPHLHFELWRNGLAQDPRDFFVGL